MNPPFQSIQALINQAQTIVIIQADNPDGDSLASALTLEEILSDLGKTVHLYCGVDIPDYLKHLVGWDRVAKDIPTTFDISIIVDTSAILLLEKLEHSEYRSWVASRPVVILDHHKGVENDIPYATVAVNDGDSVATGQLIYKLAQALEWPMNVQAKTHIASSILADSLGLASEGTSAETYRIMADLVESGVDRPALEEARRAFTKMPLDIFRYKARLIDRAEFHDDNRIALVTIPYEEITLYSPLYNPAPLIQNDLLQTEGVQVSIVLKQYNDGKTTAAIRCGYGVTIAGDLAAHFGGGGHPYASGFKVTDGRPFLEVKNECIQLATTLLAKLRQEQP